MRIKIFEENTKEALEISIRDFIKDKEVKDIKFNCVVNTIPLGDRTEILKLYQGMVMYE